MPALSEKEIGLLLEPYLVLRPKSAASGNNGPVGGVVQFNQNKGLLGQLSAYLELMIRWNEKTNLTAIRRPQDMVTRHFGESLYAGLCLGDVLPTGSTLLDFGSGAGFPGIPIQLLRPDLVVTLAESQGKKAAFLREAVRVLGLQTAVWSGRVESLTSDQTFDCVTLRAVDSPDEASGVAWDRVKLGGWLLRVAAGRAPGDGPVWSMPGLDNGYVQLTKKCE